MDILAYELLKGFDKRFQDNDTSPKLHGLKSFKIVVGKEGSGNALVERIVSTDRYWDEMLSSKGFGVAKVEKAQAYRNELIEVWNSIKEAVEGENEAVVAKLMGVYLWGLAEEDFKHSYLGVIEATIKKGKFFRKQVAIRTDIFCSYLGFLLGEASDLFEIAAKNGVTHNRAMQIKDHIIKEFESEFWFLNSSLFKNKFKSLFDINSHDYKSISSQVKKVNQKEGIEFSENFYVKALSLVFDMKLIGNINDVFVSHNQSSTGNVWTRLYLQTMEEYKRCQLDGLIDAVAIVKHEHHYYYKSDISIDISPYAELPLSELEVENYKNVICEELGSDTKLYENKILIKRNSMITQPEMVEEALTDLEGFAYAVDVLDRVKTLYPEGNWTIGNVRSALIRDDKFYAVGKNSLYGLADVKDYRAEMGDGSLNDVIEIFLKTQDSPSHLFHIFKRVNELYPRPKTIRTVHSILEQNSRGDFQKFNAGYYGLRSRNYENTSFPTVGGAHGNALKRLIQESNGIEFEKILSNLHERYDLLDVQVEHLLYKQVEDKRVALVDGLYHWVNVDDNTEILDVADDADLKDEFDIEIDEDAVGLEELDQPDMPYGIANDAIAQIKIRRGQPRFRRKLISLYKGRCIITECSILELLEAAHITPYSIKRDNSLSNGLLLRADIHTLFDIGMLAINPEDFKLYLNKSLRKSTEYSCLHGLDIGKRLNALHDSYKVSKEALELRWIAFVDSEQD